MSIRIARRAVLAACIVLVLLLALGARDGRGTPAITDNVIHLQAPSFLEVAKADTKSIASEIEDEAGMSAYFQASSAIDLADVRDAFRTIEAETSSYIIGSVPVGDYPETEDVHVYVHTDGWIMAYYLAEDPVGKIYDWRAYHDGGRTNISTKLENTIGVVASAAGVFFPSATHYDFRYPNANRLMLIVEWSYQEIDSCEVNLPSSFAYYERSWSLGTVRGGAYELNGETIQSNSSDGWRTSQGTLSVSQLPADQFHTIGVDAASMFDDHTYGYGGLALVYQVP